MEEGFLRLIKLRNERLAKNRRVEYIDGKKHVWAPGTVAGRSTASITDTFAPTPNRYSALNEWDDDECAGAPQRRVQFSGHPDHPTREEARPSEAFQLPPSVRAQNAKDYHTTADRRNSERELLGDSAAIKELMEVREMPKHQDRVVVPRQKIGRRP